MAQSFWSKRKESVGKAGGYIKAADSVSRPTAVIMTVLGILVIGGLLFGIFTGTRWAYTQLTGKKDSNTATTNGPSITATSSTSTSSTSSGTSATGSASTPASPATTTTQATPTTTATQTAAASSNNLPKTGAGSNSLLFVGLVLFAYVLHRRRQLKS